MKCSFCGNDFNPKMKSHKYCTPDCRNARRNRCPTRKENMKSWRRKSNLKRWYGLSPEDYKWMFDRQDGVCMLCTRPSRPGKSLAVDHCHITGRVRGLLCDICNRHLIGNRDLAFFERCVIYMKEPKVDEA